MVDKEVSYPELLLTMLKHKELLGGGSVKSSLISICDKNGAFTWPVIGRAGQNAVKGQKRLTRQLQDKQAALDG